MATVVDEASVSAPSSPVGDGISAPDRTISAPGATVSAAAGPVSAPTRTVSARVQRGLTLAFGILTALGGTALAVIGFAGSYSAQRHLAVRHGFGWFSPLFPVGVDMGIVVLYALDLAMIRIGRPKPVLRFAAHVFTLATIAFNIGSGGSVLADPLGAAMHAIIPCCFLLAVEAVRHFVTQWVEREAGRERPKVPLYRWILSPWRTWALYRRMRLWEMPSYEATVKAEQERIVYRAMLQRERGKNWRKDTPADLMLPIKMARFGLSVDEALAQPAKRAAADAERKQAEKARELDLKAREEAMQADAQIASMQVAAKVASAQIAIETDHQVVQAEAQATRAEAAGQVAVKQLRADAARQAAEKEQDRLARVAAEEDAAKAGETAAEIRRRAAEKAEEAAEKEKAAAETSRRAAEIKRRADEEAEAAAEARRRTAAFKLATAEDEEAAAEKEKAAAEIRRRAAEIELAALEAEDLAKLTSRQRAARKVARMILKDAEGVAENLPLKAIEEECRVSNGTASEYRAEAAELLAQGYRPAPEPKPVTVIPQQTAAQEPAQAPVDESLWPPEADEDPNSYRAIYAAAKADQRAVYAEVYGGANGQETAHARAGAV
ncbi:DUF2637 domain-containing protein [Kitasatospora sp. NBC_01302]|uniref:DUF2637 domain-containing protein n=1 Tax=Kitasatospora sp. NBC_01302 TaxID=2903575 RepID=UPI002E12312E|nr:DUF2637 domain-containing protein [Kitasatospora sp. NBC_01302]